MQEVCDTRINQIQEKIERISENVLNLENELTADEAEALRSYLLWCGYDVKHCGSYYPLILCAIRNVINPN